MNTELKGKLLQEDAFQYKSIIPKNKGNSSVSLTPRVGFPIKRNLTNMNHLANSNPRENIENINTQKLALMTTTPIQNHRNSAYSNDSKDLYNNYNTHPNNTPINPIISNSSNEKSLKFGQVSAFNTSIINNTSTIIATTRKKIDANKLIELCTLRLNKDPHDKRALYIRANSYLKLTEYQKAIIDCNLLIQNENFPPNVLYIRGCALDKIGDIDSAIQDFNQVLSIDPNHVNAAFARAACQNKKGNYAEAIEDYNMALEKDDQRRQANGNGYHHGHGHSQNNGNNNKLKILNPTGKISKPISEVITPKDNMIDFTNDIVINSQPTTSVLHSSSSPKKDNDSNRFKLYSSSNCKFSPNSSKIIQGLQAKSHSRNLNSYHGGGKVSNGGDSGGCGGVGLMNKGEGNHPVSPFNTEYSEKSIQNSLSDQKTFIQTVSTGFPTNNSSHDSQVSAHTPHNSEKKKGNKPLKWPKNNERIKEVRDLYQIIDNASEEQQHYEIKQLDTDEQRNYLKLKADWYHCKGYECRKQGDYVNAVVNYTKALKFCENNFKILVNRGFAFDKLEEFDLAINDYTQAINIDPKNAFGYYNRGITYEKKGDLDMASQDFAKAIELDPKMADFYHNYASVLKKQENYIQAIKYYTKAIEFDNKHFKAYSSRALCYDKIGNIAYAQKDYFEALKLNPNHIHTMYNVASMWERVGNNEQLNMALGYFSRVLAIDGNYASAYNGRGLVLGKLDKLTDALQDFSKALQLEPNNFDFLYNRACCLRSLGKLKDALKDLAKGIELYPKNPILYSQMGFLWRKMERYDKALESYTEELQLQGSKNSKVLENRAFCLAKLGRYPEAIADYSSILQSESKNLHSLYNRGICYESQGSYKEAIQDFGMVISLDPKNANAYFKRGCCYDAIGETSKAFIDYSLALEIDSNIDIGSKMR